MLLVLLTLQAMQVSRSAEVFVEAESFDRLGGWKLDTQFIQSMGSPYLLAHGLGKKVADAQTKVTVPEAGKYRVWVRTFDWVARWNASPSPGRFRLAIAGKAL
ncbi:MAG: NADH-dependent oxidoreductase, partial [Planctomycetota bacterium]|nr:NADH-dependent oxidoreductase [Planctomycetota bacterium]